MHAEVVTAADKTMCFEQDIVSWQKFIWTPGQADESVVKNGKTRIENKNIVGTYKSAKTAFSV